MNPWIAEQANREHIAGLRSLSRPFGVPRIGWRLGRRRVSPPQPKPVWQAVSARSGRVSVGY
jgi:hypothetical protein